MKYLTPATVYSVCSRYSHLLLVILSAVDTSKCTSLLSAAIPPLAAARYSHMLLVNLPDAGSSYLLQILLICYRYNQSVTNTSTSADTSKCCRNLLSVLLEWLNCRCLRWDAFAAFRQLNWSARSLWNSLSRNLSRAATFSLNRYYIFRLLIFSVLIRL